jgi:tetratricopeptide (TPR) repeat protein
LAEFNNLGEVFREGGKLKEAEASCCEALRLKPDYVSAYTNLGNVLHDQGRLDEARDCYRLALQIQPDFAKARFNLGNPGFKVGICWQGRPSHNDDRRRSIPLVSFAPLAEVPGVRLVALQRGDGLEQLASHSEQLRIIDLPGRSEDPAKSLLDTAALIQAVDLVLSVDTAVVHLAGALAAPVWVALPFIPDWRWLLDREDSPWYPTIRLFRQQRPRDWGVVFQRLAVKLRRKVSAAAAATVLQTHHSYF